VLSAKKIYCLRGSASKKVTLQENLLFRRKLPLRKFITQRSLFSRGTRSTRKFTALENQSPRKITTLEFIALEYFVAPSVKIINCPSSKENLFFKYYPGSVLL